MNETQLAGKLGISRKCLWERRQRFGIPRKKGRGETAALVAAGRHKPQNNLPILIYPPISGIFVTNPHTNPNISNYLAGSIYYFLFGM